MRSIVAVLVAGGVSLALVSCGGSSTPSDTVRKFMEAGKSGDKDAWMSCLVQEDREFMARMEEKGKQQQNKFAPPGGKDVDYTIEGEEIDGEKATVTVTIEQEGEKQTQTLNLAREEGEWKIALIPPELRGMLEGMEGMMKGMMEGMGEAMKKQREGMKKQ